MIEVVTNRCPRGTLLSEAGLKEFAKRKELEASPDIAAIDRTDPVLLAMMKEKNGPEKFGGHCSHIAIIELPDGFQWKLMSKGNFEWIAPDMGAPGG